jgi:uncharacterized protein
MITLAQARQWYAHADPVHDFDHIERVYRLAHRIGSAEGADMEVLLAAVLLHDIAGAAPGAPDSRSDRSSHHLASAEFARRVLAEDGWPEARIEAVLHCIRAHRFRGTEAPQSLEARILFDCDKLDVTGAIGVLRTAAYVALSGDPLTGAVSDSFRERGQKEPGERHTPYHEFLFKLSKVRFHTPAARSLAERRQRYMAEFFERLEGEVSGSD